MAKKFFKVECVSSNAQKSSVSVQFAGAIETVPAVEPGKPKQRVSRNVINWTSTDAKVMDDLRAYVPGKSYTLTIE